MTRVNRFIFLFIVILGFQMTSFAQENSDKIKQLSNGADVIITGKVKDKSSKWNENKTRIYTKTTIEVDEYLKVKQNGKSLEILTLGGEVGEVGEVYSHMPSFEENEEVLVFLKKNDQNQVYNVFHGEEGKIKVHKDSKTQEKMTGSDALVKDLKAKIKSYINKEE